MDGTKGCDFLAIQPVAVSGIAVRPMDWTNVANRRERIISISGIFSSKVKAGVY